MVWWRKGGGKKWVERYIGMGKTVLIIFPGSSCCIKLVGVEIGRKEGRKEEGREEGSKERRNVGKKKRRQGRREKWMEV